MTVTVPEGSFLLWIDYSGLNLAHPAEFLLEKGPGQRQRRSSLRKCLWAVYPRQFCADPAQKLQEALERIRQALDEKA